MVFVVCDRVIDDRSLNCERSRACFVVNCSEFERTWIVMSEPRRSNGLRSSDYIRFFVIAIILDCLCVYIYIYINVLRV